MAMNPKTRSRIRRSLLAEQDGRCTDCYDDIEYSPSEIHHIERRADGGSNRLENLVLLCPECHQERHRLD